MRPPVCKVFYLLLSGPFLVVLINPQGLDFVGAVTASPGWAALVLHGVNDESFQGKSSYLHLHGLEA